MASAEQLLHEAQYAFHSISFGESRENRRNASRAKSLCRKIIRKFPTSMEAAEAHEILRRLGEEAYSSKLEAQHRHVPQTHHHRVPSPESQRTFIVHEDVESLDWAGLVAWVFMLPKVILVMIAFAGLVLFGIFGPFLLVVLIAFVALTSPVRRMLKPEQRKDLDAFVARANATIAEYRESGGGML